MRSPGYHDLLAELKLDKVHLARYSPRPRRSARAHAGRCPAQEKKRRHAALEALQERVVAEINSRFLGKTVEVLVEDQPQGQMAGTLPQNKLVSFRGRLAGLAGQAGDGRDHLDRPLEYAGAAGGRGSTAARVGRGPPRFR